MIGLILCTGLLLLLFCCGCVQEQPAVTPTPTATPTPVATTPVVTTSPVGMNIVETAVSDGRFTTLVAAVTAAKLDGTLSGPGPFTVFAPTDDAFAQLPAGTLDTLLKDPEGQLTQILLYHVIPEKVISADVVKLTQATTVQGGNVTITVDGGNVMINDAKVIIADVECSNGVIHVIDKVLIPPS